MYILLLALGAIGHVILWVALVNRAHGLGIQRRWVNLMTLGCVIMFFVMPCIVAAVLLRPSSPRLASLVNALHAAAWLYVAGCAAVCVAAVIQRIFWWRHSERRGALLKNHSTTIRIADHVAEPLAAPGFSTWLCRLPGNEALNLCLQEKEIGLPRLRPEHAGLRIAHLSDLHMSGRIAKAYFQHVIDQVNRREPDLVAVTGDIVEFESCLSWIPDTLGRLHAPGGVYYVLGNHDRRVDQSRLPAALAAAGLVHLRGAALQITVSGTPLILAGNELPWYGPAADFANCPRHDDSGLPLRIALVHSPDQLGWAVSNDVDLMLAGHVHGGQVCLPLIGPVTAPSLHGVRYAAGTFRKDQTVMHVSRGTSALTPLRWNCPPEVAMLTLRNT